MLWVKVRQWYTYCLQRRRHIELGLGVLGVLASQRVHARVILSGSTPWQALPLQTAALALPHHSPSTYEYGTQTEVL